MMVLLLIKFFYEDFIYSNITKEIGKDSVEIGHRPRNSGLRFEARFCIQGTPLSKSQKQPW